MKNILIVFLILILNLSNAQIRLKQLEPCYDNLGNRKDSCFTMTDMAGHQYYIGLDDLISIISKSAINCDSIGNCLLSGNLLCTALGQFPVGLPNINDYLIARNGNNCKRILLDSLIGGTTLCNALNFSISTISGSDYFLVKKANGDCRKVLVSSVGIGFNCDSVEACLVNGALCEALRGFAPAVPAAIDSFVFIKGGVCKKGVLSSLISDVSCDSVLACLNDGVLCDALRNFSSGTIGVGDSVFFSDNGVCKKGLVNDLLGGGSFNCDSVKKCISESWFCDSVETCLTDGALCAALTQLDIDGGGSGYYVYGDDDNGNCVRIPFDSVNAVCGLEIEVGAFGGNPQGCSFATQCNGGARTNRHWVYPLIDGCDMQIWGGAEGNSDCLMGEVGLPVPTVTNTSTCSGGNINLGFNYTYCGVTTAINLGSISLSRNFGTNVIELRYNNSVCATAAICPTNCAPALVAPSQNITSIQQVDISKLKRYANHVLADKDKGLPSGGLYLVAKSRSIQVKL